MGSVKKQTERDMPCGYKGTILKVDLTTGAIKTEKLRGNRKHMFSWNYVVTEFCNCTNQNNYKIFMEFT
jgi:hypothetical protein